MNEYVSTTAEVDEDITSHDFEAYLEKSHQIHEQMRNKVILYINDYIANRYSAGVKLNTPIEKHDDSYHMKLDTLIPGKGIQGTITYKVDGMQGEDPVNEFPLYSLEGTFLVSILRQIESGNYTVL